MTGADEMWEVVKKLSPDRIGHGIRCVDDPKLMDFLREKSITLEVCPLSNLQTSAVKDWDELTSVIQTLVKLQVPFTINSDGPELLGTSVKEEFEVLLEKNIMTKEDVIRCNEVAQKATFVI